jgi:predicted DNA-binding protein
MEKLIPYSIHLKPETYERIKEAAGDRKAAAVIRGALELYFSNSKVYDKAYDDGVLDAMKEVEMLPLANSLQWQGETLAQVINRSIKRLL